MKVEEDIEEVLELLHLELTKVLSSRERCLCHYLHLETPYATNCYMRDRNFKSTWKIISSEILVFVKWLAHIWSFEPDRCMHAYK